MKSDQIIARILLSVLFLSAMALGVIWIAQGYVPYGLLLLLPGLALLIWIWIPRRQPGKGS